MMGQLWRSFTSLGANYGLIVGGVHELSMIMMTFYDSDEETNGL